jgi:hypothetical protein
MGIRHVVNLLKLANNDLPLLENRYHRLKKEVDDLERQRVNSRKILHKLEDQILNYNQILDHYRISCREEIRKLGYLRREVTRLGRLVTEFKKNNEEYLKIKNIIEVKVSRILLDGKGLLRLAFFSLMDSMRKDPDKYSSLIHYNNASSTRNISQDYIIPSNYHQVSYYTSYDYFFEAYKSTLINDAEKLYYQLLQEQVDDIISNYDYNRNSSLPLRNAISRQTFGYRREITFRK